MLLAVTLLVGLVMPAIAVPMVLMNTTDVGAADRINEIVPDEFDPVTVGAGQWVLVNFSFHSDQDGAQDFVVHFVNESLDPWNAAEPNTLTHHDTNQCTNYSLSRWVQVKPGAASGWYCVRVWSITNTSMYNETCGSLYIDGDAPEVELLTPTTEGNYRNSNTINVTWTMYDEGGIYNVSLWYSDDCGGNWTMIPKTGIPDEVWWNGSTQDPGDPVGTNRNATYYHWVHVGNMTDGYKGVNSTISNNETCRKGHIEVRVEDWVNLTNSSKSGDPGFTIDNTPPKVNIDYPTGSETWEGCTMEWINFTYSDNCGPLKYNISYSTSSYGGPWYPITKGKVNLTWPGPGVDGHVNYSWHVPVTINTSDFHIRVNVTDCPNNDGGDVTPPFRVVSPLKMIDAITGWIWPWTGERHPVNANDRSTIMVVFNKPLNFSTVSVSDFNVVGKTITDMQINQDHITGRHDGAWQGFAYVFLEVMPIMATDETPTVQLVGCVRAMDPSVDPLCGNLTHPVTPDWGTQDGIAPIISVTANPEDPGVNEEVTVTVTASECLNEAYIFIERNRDRWPQDYDWNMCKPIGWPTDWWTQEEWGSLPLNSSDRKQIWEQWSTPCCLLSGDRCQPNWHAMMPADDYMCNAGSKTWTYTFFNHLSERVDWFVEVAAHDFSIHSLSNEEMPFMPWKHEKWTEESLLFWSFDRYNTTLCEGWNLISIPGEPVDNTLHGVFGSYGSGVTAVHTYTTYAGGAGMWESAFLDPVSGMWIGSLYEIKPGVGYWVWCSPPEMNLRMYLNPVDPLAGMPSFDLQAGWNLIGVIDWGRYYASDPDPIHHFPLVWLDWYLGSLMVPDNAMVLWGYCNCERDWYSYIWNKQWMSQDSPPKIAPLMRGFWLSCSRPITLFPAGVDIPW
jgi:hypothetical protein